MMLSEEKKAIETVSNLKTYYEAYYLLSNEEIEENEEKNGAIEIVLNLITRLEKENESLNKMGETYKLALFMIIRNSTVMPKGIELGKNDKEINEMSYETLCEVLAMVDYNIAKKLYEEGETTFENKAKGENK